MCAKDLFLNTSINSLHRKISKGLKELGLKSELSQNK